MAKKKKYQAPKADTKELQEFREHIKMIDEKSKAISEKYKMWWDSGAKRWKRGFDGHGDS
jgi:hypothetical protein